jgi:hypothetical protein
MHYPKNAENPIFQTCNNLKMAEIPSFKPKTKSWAIFIGHNLGLASNEWLK